MNILLRFQLVENIHWVCGWRLIAKYVVEIIKQLLLQNAVHFSKRSSHSDYCRMVALL